MASEPHDHGRRFHTDSSSRQHLHARRSVLGPAADNDVEIVDRRSAQDVRQTGGVLLAAVQQQQEGVQRILAEDAQGHAAEV